MKYTIVWLRLCHLPPPPLICEKVDKWDDGISVNETHEENSRSCNDFRSTERELGEYFHPVKRSTCPDRHGQQQNEYTERTEKGVDCVGPQGSKNPKIKNKK